MHARHSYTRLCQVRYSTNIARHPRAGWAACPAWTIIQLHYAEVAQTRANTQGAGFERERFNMQQCNITVLFLCLTL